MKSNVFNQTSKQENENIINKPYKESKLLTQTDTYTGWRGQITDFLVTLMKITILNSFGWKYRFDYAFIVWVTDNTHLKIGY